jgi:hypothetical protein
MSGGLVLQECFLAILKAILPTDDNFEGFRLDRL